MDTHTDNLTQTSAPMNDLPIFEPGMTVIYGFHGKCQISAIETRRISNEELTFYKLEIQRSPLSRSNKKETAIWVPTNSAHHLGMRNPMTAAEVELAKSILSSKEYYFPLNLSWDEIQPKLDLMIRTQGAIGLAKVASYLYVLNKKAVYSNSQALKLQESVNKLLFKEMADALNTVPKEVEASLAKPMRQKLQPNH